jgi:hypothetical protein
MEHSHIFSLYNTRYIVFEGYAVQQQHAAFCAVVMKCSLFWDITPCSPLKAMRRFGEKFRLHLPDFTLVSCLAYSSTLKLEEICSSEASVDL